MKKSREIAVHIDELVLPYLPHGGERRLREAVQKELQRLLAKDAVKFNQSQIRDRDEVNIGKLKPRRSGHSENMGQEIAGKIYKGAIAK